MYEEITQKIIDILEADGLLHNCDSVSGWTIINGSGSINADAADKKEGAASARADITTDGSGYAVIKSNTGLGKSISNRNFLYLWVKTSLLTPMFLFFNLYTAPSDFRQYTLTVPAIDTWTLIKKGVSDYSSETGTFDPSSINAIGLAGAYIGHPNEAVKIWLDYASIDDVKRYYFGEHDITKPNTIFPFTDVKWRGGSVNKLKTGSVITRRQIDFVIRLVQRHVDEDTCEKFVMQHTEQVETVLDADPTLGGLVENSWITEVLSDSIPVGGFAVVGSMTRLKTKRT